MKIYINIAIMLAIMSFGTCIASGQVKRAVVSGKIVDSNGDAISLAAVSIINQVGVSVAGAVSSDDGAFEIRSLLPGKYKVVVAARGFAAWEEEIALENGQEKGLEAILSPGGIEASVSVIATRTQVSTDQTAISVTVLDREKIERSSLSTIGDAFRNLNGVSTVNEGAFQVRPRIRGFDSNRVLVLVDGERLNNARTSTVQSGIELGLVGVDQVDSVEVVRGAGSVLYGTDALGGTINIVTRDAPRNLDTGFRFGAGFNGIYSTTDKGRRGTASVNGSSKSLSFRVSQSLDRFENYHSGKLDGRTVSGVASDGEVLNSQSHGASTKITTRFFFGDDSDLKLSYDRQRTGNIGVPTLVGVFNAYFPFSNRDKFGGRYELRNVTNNFARLNASAYYQRQNRKFDTKLVVPAALPYFPGQQEFSQTTTDTRSIGLDIQTDWQLPLNNFLTAGISFFRDHNKDDRLRDAYLPNFRTRPPSLTRVTETSPSLPNAKFGSFALFAQDQFQATNRIKLVGGIRAERFISKAEPTSTFAYPALLTPEQIAFLGLEGLKTGVDTANNAITGDLAAIVNLSRYLDLTAKIGRSYRVPNLFERFYTGVGSIGGIVVGNPNLKPESGINFETGLRFRNEKLQAGISYFNGVYKNLLSNEEIGIINGTPVAIQDGLYQTVNIGKARIQGVEAEIQAPMKIKMGYLTPTASISYLRGDDLESMQPLTTITPLKTVLNVRWQNLLNNYYFDLTTRIVNKQNRLSYEYVTANGGAEAGFAVTDLGGGYIYKRERFRLNVNASIRNIFDRFYSEQYVLAPARGISFVFGTTWELN